MRKHLYRMFWINGFWAPPFLFGASGAQQADYLVLIGITWTTTLNYCSSLECRHSPAPEQHKRSTVSVHVFLHALTTQGPLSL